MKYTKFKSPSKDATLPLHASFDSLPPARFAVRPEFRLPYLALALCVLWTLCGKLSAKENPFNEIATELAEETNGEPVNVGVGSFNFENTDLQSPFSSMLREEIEIALDETGKFKVVTRDRLADLQMEGKFQGKGILEPGTGVEKVTIEGVKGIVRGRFYSSDDEVTIFAELAWLEGGEVKKTRISIPADKVKAKIWPDSVEAARKPLETAIKPQNVEQSLANVEEIAKDRLASVPKDFQVEIFTVDGKRAYAEGETVSFRVRSAEECHIAVLCHQSDGTSVVLFPNSFASNTLIPANKAIDIPGTHKSGFEIEIGPPFGSDVVEVIACTKPTELLKQFSKTAAAAQPEAPFQVLTRGMAVKGVSKAVSSTAASSDAPPRWGQDSVVVSTFPKP